MATSGITVHRRGRRRALAATLTAAAAVAGLVMVGLPGTTALFTADYPVGADIAASRIFRDERTTAAFSVSDASSGSAADQSSATAFAADSRYFLSRTWPTSFDSARYLDLETNAPLPAGLSVSNGALNLRVSSDAGTGSVCVYVELRRASNNNLLSSHGSSGSPLACTSGTSTTVLNVSLSAVTTTDLANDLRVRIFARDSAAGALRVDQATVTGDTPYVTFTLYPILTREAYSGSTELIRWGLAGP
jgi:hypothetical protein